MLFEELVAVLADEVLKGGVRGDDAPPAHVGGGEDAERDGVFRQQIANRLVANGIDTQFVSLEFKPGKSVDRHAAEDRRIVGERTVAAGELQIPLFAKSADFDDKLLW